MFIALRKYFEFYRQTLYVNIKLRYKHSGCYQSYILIYAFLGGLNNE